MMITRRSWYVIGLTLLALHGRPLAITKAEETGRPSRPNVILIMTDDQGWGDLHSHGNEKIDTPTMDQLAREGAQFDRFFVSPMCGPTRASLLTGRWNLRTGCSWVSHGKEIVRLDETTMGDAFKSAG